MSPMRQAHLSRSSHTVILSITQNVCTQWCAVTRSPSPYQSRCWSYSARRQEPGWVDVRLVSRFMLTKLESIKSVAKTLAGGIVEAYKETLAEDRVPGLFSEPYYWWEAGTVFNGLIEYSHLTGDTQYNALISQALQHQLGDYNAFMPPNQTKTLGNDDQSSWGLAAMNAAEVGFPKPNGTEWVDIAANVFNTQAVRYDIEEKAGTCGGGLRWQIFTFNAGYSYKNAASNGNFFLLAARLAKFTGNATYSQYADKVYKWSKAAKLVTDDYRVYDGTDANTNCSSTQKLLWTATHGAYTEGAALMYNIVCSFSIQRSLPHH